MTSPVVLVGRKRGVGWRRVTRGVHRPTDADVGLLSELAAWQVALPPTAVFTGPTGSAVRGWWLPRLPQPVPVMVGVPHGDSRPRRPGLAVYRHSGPRSFDQVDGLRVASPAEILLAAGRDLRLLDLVILADAALHARHAHLCDLVAAAQTRRHGSTSLRQALLWVDGRAEPGSAAWCGASGTASAAARPSCFGLRRRCCARPTRPWDVSAVPSDCGPGSAGSPSPDSAPPGGTASLSAGPALGQLVATQALESQPTDPNPRGGEGGGG